jgi:polyphosphate kinase 2 (PPK2 family)
VARREERFEAIRNHELHLAREGTVVLKFMLHASKEMQARRLLRRIELPEKRHKLSPSDLPERDHWELYQHAYEEAIRETSCEWAPWCASPAAGTALVFAAQLC